jgi:hypothetical protein
MVEPAAVPAREHRMLPYLGICLLIGIPLSWAPVVLGWIGGPGWGRGA